MGCPHVSDWKYSDPNSTLSRDEFFLTFEEYRGLYTAHGDYQIKDPIEQLSAKGIALSSYLYALKDNDYAQPLVASTTLDLEHIIRLIDNAPVGTQVPIIFQATDGELNMLEYTSVHKTFLYIEKLSTHINIIHIDSINRETGILKYFISNALAQNKKQDQQNPSPCYYHTPTMPLNEKGQPHARLKDNYQCGTTAIRDARTFIKQPNIKDIIIESSKKVKDSSYNFPLPATFYKNVQSRRFAAQLKTTLGDKIVTRKNKTLLKAYEKYNDIEYAHYFSKKLEKSITTFVATKKAHELKTAVEQYDAGKMDLNRLIERYGPKISQESEFKRKFDKI